MKKLTILGAANPNVIRTIDSMNLKKQADIIVECFVDNDKKKNWQRLHEYTRFRYSNFFRKV